jgi:peptidoglycan/LPS O-acetylase OafA/YrhL
MPPTDELTIKFPLSGSKSADTAEIGYSNEKYIRGLDGLRAFSILIVILGHANLSAAIPGGFGVTIFFFVSGFLITRLLLAEYGRSGRVDLPRFYARRFVRLYPELLVMLALMAVISPFVGWQASALGWASASFYAMNYYQIFSMQVLTDQMPWRPLWSLAVEEHFYLIFPALILVMKGKSRGILIALSAILILAPIWRTVLYVGFGADYWYPYTATEARIDSIAWGCLLAVLTGGSINDNLPARYVRPLLQGYFPFLIGAVLLLGSLVVRDETFRWTIRFTIQGVGLFLVIGTMLTDERFRLFVNMLEVAPLRWIGRVSYGAYLYHMPLLGLMSAQGLLVEGSILSASFALAITLLVAGLSYYAIERPLVPLRRRLGSAGVK